MIRLHSDGLRSNHMKASLPLSILSSPKLLALLLCATMALLAGFYWVSRSQDAPTMAGYNWQSHPKVLMVVSPISDSCRTCNLSLAGWATLGRQHSLEVLVVARRPTEEVKALQKSYDSPYVTVVTGVDESTIRRFAPEDKIAGVVISNGHIVAEQQGGSPSPAFLAAK